MTTETDIAKIAEQEARLVFDSFDEAKAFALGSLIRERGLEHNWPIVIEVRFWDRLLFYAALPGSTSSNTDWVRRKLNVVKMFHKSTYRMVLTEQRPDRTFKPGTGLSASDYVLAGGGFPITVNGVGVVGGIGVSGLPEREDHAVVVGALCEMLGMDEAGLVLAKDAQS